MSAIDHLRSFAATRARDNEVIRGGITYGHARSVVAHCDGLVSALDEATADLRTLRRELAARQAVDGWLKQHRHILEVYHDGSLHVCSKRGPFHIEAPDYPALATALGLDWEETK